MPRDRVNYSRLYKGREGQPGEAQGQLGSPEAQVPTVEPSSIKRTLPDVKQRVLTSGDFGSGWNQVARGSEVASLNAKITQQMTTRVKTSIATTSSGTFTTTRTEVMSVTAPLVAGNIYRVTFDTAMRSSVNNDIIMAAIQQDSAAGAIVNERPITTVNFSLSTGYPRHIEGEFTAASTEDKTFKGTGVRVSGSGNGQMIAASGRVSYLYVDYIRPAG